MRDPTRDIVRGINILEMELVNNCDLSGLGHASIEENGITYADTIFPTFAFLAGMSRTPTRRSVGLMGLGLAYNGLSIIEKKKDFKMRYFGVLQRTGLASLLFNTFSATDDYKFAVAATSFWCVASVLLAHDPKDPWKSPEDSAQTYIDRRLVGQSSLYKPEYDPEGFLGALMTAVTLEIGSKYASSTFSPCQNVAIGAGFIALGFSLGKLFPRYFRISKSYWTPSFVLIAGGSSILKYTAISAAVPYLPQAVQYVLTCVGRRSLEIYLSDRVLLLVSSQLGIWQKLKDTFSQWFGPKAGELTLVTAWNGLLAGLAVLYVKYGLKIAY